MDHVIIGTAGHVDHGKTCLIKALTGIDTDRLKEEKKRGITIELGFAYLDFPDGRRVGIVDVPGHEKFVKNMLAGAGGMDLAMLVVAADEGIMPQTVEHLDILSILGISKGVVVITKTDLAEPELVELVEEEIKELTEGTFLQDAPVIPVSVYEKKGLEELKSVLKTLCDSLPERSRKKHFRLPIDRIFTLKGFGTVVTGTLMEGTLRKDQDVVLYPENVPVRIRSVQVHGQGVDEAYAGQRAAVNLPDRKKSEILRGDVLASVNSLFPSRMLDVRLEVLKHARREVKHGSRVHIYHGTKELLGKIVLMNRDSLKAGESCYAQLRLEEETAAKKGDRFVIRFYSPVETLGGGTVLDACPRKHRKNDKKALDAFVIKEKGNDRQRLELSCLEHQGNFFTLEELALRDELNRSGLKNLALSLVKENLLVQVGEDRYIHREELREYERKVTRFLDEFHKEYPLKEGMGIEEARSRLGIQNGRIADSILTILKERKVIKESEGIVSRYRFRVVVKEDEGAMIQEILDYYLEAGFAPLTTELYMKEHRSLKKFPAVLTSLINKKTLIRLDGQYCVHREYYEKAKAAFGEMAREKPEVILGEFRDYLGCSRKIAVALLEHFDKSGYTRKTENGRVLRG